MPMLWQPFNFKIILDKRFKNFCEIIRNGSTSDSQVSHTKKLIQLEILPAKTKNQTLLQDYTSKQIRYGELYFNLQILRLQFFYNDDDFDVLHCLNILLINIIKLLGLQFQTFLLHSATVIKKKEAFVIPGKQGRGKTTLSQNLKKYSILNDDLSLIVKEARNWVVYKIPDPLHLLKTDPFLWQGPFSIKKIIFIRNNYKEKLKKLVTDNAFTAFFEENPSLFVANHNIDQQNMYQNLIKDLITNTDSFLVSYTPDTDSKFLRELQQS